MLANVNNDVSGDIAKRHKRETAADTLNRLLRERYLIFCNLRLLNADMRRVLLD